MTHKVSIPYHPQSNDQVELASREIKQIIKQTINPTCKDWYVSVVCNISNHCGSEQEILLQFRSCNTQYFLSLIKRITFEISRECDDRNMIRVTLFNFR